VRLTRLDGARTLVVETDGRTRTLRRVGASVAADDETGADERGPWLALEGRRHRLDERLYTGSLLVEPRAAGGLQVTNHVELEDYVRGVVAAELALWSAPPALLEAQAVAARSYALAQLGGRGVLPPRPCLLDSVVDQAYAGQYEPGPSASARAVAARLDAAVRATRGLVLKQGAEVLDARFHAACGGTTAAFADVFTEPDPGGLVPVPCPPCRAADVPAEASTAGHRAWTWRASAAELDRLARSLDLGPGLRALVPTEIDPYGRWLAVRLEGDRASARLSLAELRSRVGWKELRSGRVTAVWPRPGEPLGAGLVVQGRGFGHGVGLCQDGARALAEAGWSARRILAHYFPRARLGRRPSVP